MGIRGVVSVAGSIVVVPIAIVTGNTGCPSGRGGGSGEGSLPLRRERGEAASVVKGTGYVVVGAGTPRELDES